MIVDNVEGLVEQNLKYFEEHELECDHCPDCMYVCQHCKLVIQYGRIMEHIDCCEELKAKRIAEEERQLKLIESLKQH